jgi:hypothetical protein
MTVSPRWRLGVVWVAAGQASCLSSGAAAGDALVFARVAGQNEASCAERRGRGMRGPWIGHFCGG